MDYCINMKSAIDQQQQNLRIIGSMRTIPSLTLITLASVDLKYNYEGQGYDMKETTRLFHAMLINIELLFAVSG